MPEKVSAGFLRDLPKGTARLVAASRPYLAQLLHRSLIKWTVDLISLQLHAVSDVDFSALQGFSDTQVPSEHLTWSSDGDGDQLLCRGAVANLIQS